MTTVVPAMIKMVDVKVKALEKTIPRRTITTAAAAIYLALSEKQDTPCCRQ